MRKGRDGEWNGKKNGKKNNGENSGPLTPLPVDSLTATDCNAAARAKIMAEIVATTSLPVNCLTATDCNAAARANTYKLNIYFLRD